MKILATGAVPWGETDWSHIGQLGHSVVFLQHENEPLPCDAAEIEMAICNGLFLYHPIEEFRSLKYIQLTSAGFDRVPLDYTDAHGIKVYNARGVYSIPMAEYAVCGVLQLCKQSAFFYGTQKKRSWEKHRGLQELYGKTVCIIGCGSVGTECAKRFQAFQCEIIGVDLVPYTAPDCYNAILDLSNLDKVLRESDIVVLTLPLTEATRHLMNQDRFSHMKDGALLVNIARGAIVDTAALLEALQYKLGGAVLDVFEEEPLRPDSPLWNMDRVILTPHNSFVGPGNRQRLLDGIYDTLKMLK